MERESPFLLYVGLKIYSIMRSRIVIDIFHARGLCISYERILGVTLGFTEVTLNLFEHEEDIIPSNLCTNSFTIRAKGTIEKNLRCTYLKSCCHAISLSLLQFFSTVNLGEERYYEKYVHQQIVERWKNYLHFTQHLKRSKILLKYFLISFNSKHSR